MNAVIVGKDKYYTKLDTVSICMSWFLKHVSVEKNDLIIEPSAGDGSFIYELDNLECTKLYYDIEPHHPSIQQQDFLRLNTVVIEQMCDQKIHVIGNPPFGKKSSLAILFIKIACTFCDTLSFILPKSFKKNSLKRSFAPRFHLVFEGEIPPNSFLLGGETSNVPCIFQIWEKRDIPRDIPIKMEPFKKLYRFVRQDEHPDFSFRRVGVNAGRIDRNCAVSEQSHYFIKFNIEINENLWNTMKSTSFDDCKMNTVGSFSISKQELIEKYNKILNV